MKNINFSKTNIEYQIVFMYYGFCAYLHICISTNVHTYVCTYLHTYMHVPTYIYQKYINCSMYEIKTHFRLVISSAKIRKNIIDMYVVAVKSMNDLLYQEPTMINICNISCQLD